MTQEAQVTKRCPFMVSAVEPFLQQEGLCIKEACALWMEFDQVRLGVRHKMGTCSFVGTNLILSEMKTHLKQQGNTPIPQIVIPGNGRR